MKWVWGQALGEQALVPHDRRQERTQGAHTHTSRTPMRKCRLEPDGCVCGPRPAEDYQILSQTTQKEATCWCFDARLPIHRPMREWIDAVSSHSIWRRFLCVCVWSREINTTPMLTRSFTFWTLASCQHYSLEGLACGWFSSKCSHSCHGWLLLGCQTQLFLYKCFSWCGDMTRKVPMRRITSRTWEIWEACGSMSMAALHCPLPHSRPLPTSKGRKKERRRTSFALGKHMTFLSCVLVYNGLVPRWLTSSAQQSPPPPARPITRGTKLTKVRAERLRGLPLTRCHWGWSRSKARARLTGNQVAAIWCNSIRQMESTGVSGERQVLPAQRTNPKWDLRKLQARSRPDDTGLLAGLETASRGPKELLMKMKRVFWKRKWNQWAATQPAGGNDVLVESIGGSG